MRQSSRAAIYVRISRDKQGGGLGIDRQRHDCEELAARSGWSIVNTYTDNDLSAYSGKARPEYRRLLANIEAGLVDVVIVWHTDRLHRAPIELEEWLAVAEPRGIEVHCVKSGPLDLATPSGRMVARQLGAVARYESEHRSERISAKNEQIARDGGFLGGVRPFGYTADGMELVANEAELIREGTRMILSRRSLRSVGRLFIESGTVTTKAGRKWTSGAVRDLLTRARNAGLLEHRGHVVGPARWPAIVTSDEWRGVCAVFNNPNRRTSPGNQPRWLGSMIYKCGVCGGVLYVGTSGGKRFPSYRCRNTSSGDGPHVTRQAATLDTFVARVIVARLSQSDAVNLFLASTPEIDTSDVMSQLAGIAQQREELAGKFGNGEITTAMLDAANGPLRRRQTELEAVLAAAVEVNPLRGLVGQPDVKGAWDAQPIELQRIVLSELFEVTVLPAPRGRQADGGYFDSLSIKIEPKIESTGR